MSYKDARDEFLDKMLPQSGGKARLTDAEIASSLAQIDSALSGVTATSDQQRRQLADIRGLLTDLRYRIGDPSLPPSTPGSYVPPNGPYKSLEQNARKALKRIRFKDGHIEVFDPFWRNWKRKD